MTERAKDDARPRSDAAGGETDQDPARSAAKEQGCGADLGPPPREQSARGAGAPRGAPHPIESDRHADSETSEAAEIELAGPVLLPAGLRTDWPVPRVAVHGPRDGIDAYLEYTALRAMLKLLAGLPAPLRRASIGAIAALAHRFDREHARSARVFLRQALGRELSGRDVEARVRQTWRHFLEVLVDSEGFDRHVGRDRSVVDHFAIELSEGVRDLLASRRGTILITAHVGDWEAASALMPWLGFDPFYAIAKPARNRPLSAHIQRVRERRGIRLLPRHGAMKYAGRVIAAGGTLAMLLDQRARVKPVIAPFFGRPARCDRGAGVLLKRLSAPVVFAACYRTPERWRYRLVIDRVWQPAEIARERPEEIARRINVEIERMILAAPEQYFWLHDRYRGAPEE